MKSLKKTLGYAALCTTMSLPVLAQEAPIANRKDFEEIIVTARKRSETVLETPYSVTALSAKVLDDYQMNQVQDASRLVPNLYIDSLNNSSAARISLRGISSPATVPSFEQSVGLNIDGLAFGRARWIEVGMFDVQQFEVLRGPQGLYFGKNTTGGIINFVSRDPGNKFEATAKVGYEFASTQEALFEGSISGPITDTLGARLAIQYRDERGFMKDLVQGGYQPNTKSLLLRGTVVWKVSDSFDVRFKSFYARQRTYGLNTELSYCAPNLVAFLAANNSKEDCQFNNTTTRSLLIPGDFYNTLFPGGSKSVNFNDGTYNTLEMNWRHDNFEIKSITGYHTSEVVLKQDTDNFDLPAADSGTPEKNQQFSQELRFNTKIGDRIDVMLGAFYDRDKLKAGSGAALNLAVIGTPIVGGFVETLHQIEESEAVFSEVSLGLTDSFRVIPGVRYTHETKNAHLDQDVGSIGNPFDHNPTAVLLVGLTGRTQINLNGTYSTHHVDPSVVVQWDFTKDMPSSVFDSGQVYASFKKGFKSGGFDLIAGQTPAGTGTPNQNFIYGDEYAKAYEVGFKFSSLNRRLQGSFDIYTTKFDKLQVQSFQTTASLIVQTFNAAAATAKGFEADLNYQVTDDLNVSGAFGYNHARFDQFPLAPCYALQTAAQGCVGGRQDLAGKTLVAAPDVTANLGFNWSRPVHNDLTFTLGSTAVYVSRVQNQVQNSPATVAPSRWTLDAHLGLAGQGWEIALIGRNLTDETIYDNLRDAVFFNGSLSASKGAPRTVAIQLTVKR